MLRKPNTFIIGAPKCGTTALCEYLKTHPNVFFSNPKELLFWADDFPRANESSHTPIHSVDQYMRVFSKVSSEHSVIAEGTVTYLYSKSAVKRIIEFNPAAKFIVMARNPIAMAESWYGELCYNGYEDLLTFEEAWNAQGDRALQKRIPYGCKVPEFLQYKAVCSVGEQVERLLRIVPPSQVHLLSLEAFIANPLSEYRQVLRFLGLDDDGRTEFPSVNEAKAMRIRALRRLFCPPRILKPGIDLIRRSYGLAPRAIRSRIDMILRPKRTRNRLSAILLESMAKSFHEDQLLLSSLMEGYCLGDYVSKKVHNGSR